MSKSLGNFVTIRQLLDDWHGYGWPGEALRFNMLRTHYRQPIDWTPEGVDESHKTLWDWYGDLENVSENSEITPPVLEALCDDLNTPALIAALHSLHKDRNLAGLRYALKLLGFSLDRKRLDRVSRLPPFVQDQSQDAAAQVVRAAYERQRSSLISSLSGEVFVPPPMSAESAASLSGEEIEKLVAARNEARKAKNFAEADRIRGLLAAARIILKDSKDGTTWEIAR
jgi:cysteinyl-tRNA synthetase